jgi:hypothetical protein
MTPWYARLCRARVALFLAVPLLAAGCARLPVAAPLPAGVTVTRLAAVDPGAPVACNPAGAGIAYGHDGLRLTAAGSGGERQLAPEEPLFLAWSPDGTALAAVFDRAPDSLLRWYGSDGVLQHEAAIAGRAVALGWSAPHEVTVAAFWLNRYTFGATLLQTLHRWDGRSAPRATNLPSTTLMPKTVKSWADQLPALLRFAPSPAGDAFVYSRLKDPPLFPPLVQILLVHPESGSSTLLAEFPPVSVSLSFTPNGDAVVYGDGNSSRRYDPWGERELARHPQPGRSLALSPGGERLFLDGRLYLRGAERAQFPAESRGCFAGDAGTLVVEHDGSLFAVAGWPPETAHAIGPEERERQLTLRRWRSRGLITADDYRRAVERKEQP